MKDKIKMFFSNRWFITFLLIPFIKPATELTGKFDIIFDILKIISMTIILISYIYYNKKISKIILLIFMFEITFYISTIINNGKIWWATVQLFSILSVCCLMELTIKLDKKEFLIGFSIPLTIMTLATVFSMFIFYPNGMYTVEHIRPEFTYIEKGNYLWGFDNSSIFKIVPTMIMIILCSNYFDKKWIKYFTLITLLFITSAFLYVKSITAATICILITIYYIFLIYKNKTIKILNYKNIIIIFVLISIIIIGMNKNITFLQDIAKQTDKIYSLNARFIYWNNTLDEFIKSPIIGYGFEENSTTISKIGIDHPHNITLDILYRGGIISLIFFISILITTILNYRGKQVTKSENIIAIGILALLLVSQLDYYNDQYLLFFIFALSYFSYYLEKDNSICDNKEE